MDDLASQVLHQLETLHAHEDAAALELHAQHRYSTSVLRCRTLRGGRKAYVVTTSWSGTTNDLCFGFDEMGAEAAVRLLLLAPDRHSYMRLRLFDAVAQKVKELFYVPGLGSDHGGEAGVAAVVRLLPIIEWARPADELCEAQ